MRPPEQIEEVRQQLGYDQPFAQRYARYLTELFTLNLGASNSSGEQVAAILKRTVPVTLALMIPGFLLGNLLGIALGLTAARHKGRWIDQLITGLSVTGMSISFLVIIIVLQVLLSTPYGLNLFPVRGWQVTDPASYLKYVTVPTLSLIFVTLGYNTRFYRAVFVEESGKDHIRTARAYGASTHSFAVEARIEKQHGADHYPNHVLHSPGRDLRQPVDRKLFWNTRCRERSPSTRLPVATSRF